MNNEYYNVDHNEKKSLLNVPTQMTATDIINRRKDNELWKQLYEYNRRDVELVDMILRPGFNLPFRYRHPSLYAARWVALFGLISLCYILWQVWLR